MATLKQKMETRRKARAVKMGLAVVGWNLIGLAHLAACLVLGDFFQVEVIATLAGLAMCGLCYFESYRILRDHEQAEAWIAEQVRKDLILKFKAAN